MFKKLFANTFLLGVLFGLLALPFGSMGLAAPQTTTVLGDEDARIIETLPKWVTEEDYQGIDPTIETTPSEEQMPQDIEVELYTE